VKRLTVKEEILKVLVKQGAMTCRRIFQELIKKGSMTTVKALSVYLVDLQKEKLIYLDRSTRPGVYSIPYDDTARQVGAHGSIPVKPVRLQSENFPEYMVAIRRKGREFRHPFKDDKELGTFLDKLGEDDEVAIYKKIEVKKEVKTVWKL
jgi:hypothetical protein